MLSEQPSQIGTDQHGIFHMLLDCILVVLIKRAPSHLVVYFCHSNLFNLNLCSTGLSVISKNSTCLMLHVLHISATRLILIDHLPNICFRSICQ